MIKAPADDNLKVAYTMEPLFDRVDYSVGKKEMLVTIMFSFSS